MLSEVLSGVLVGVECVLVRVEVSVASGLPSISVVGLAHGAVREAKDRVRAALQHAGYSLPPRRITVNLAPADLRKDGGGFDLPLAVGLLVGAGHVPRGAVEGTALLGELGLNGELRPIRGALALAAACWAERLPRLIVPLANAREAAVGGGGLDVRGARTLTEVVEHLRGRASLAKVRVDLRALLSPEPSPEQDFADVRGHVGVKRALEIAAAGAHNVLMLGPPGSGKTMLARRLAGILPSMALEEAVEVTTIHSVAGTLPAGEALVGRRPFRAPHHTVSPAGLVGGGLPLRPGEVSLAHNGVLFLDELPEHSRNSLECLRQPAEDGWVSIVRARERVRFPARFMLVAAMNPCPCGYLGSSHRACTCDPGQVDRYRSRVSGPLMDRIDITLHVPTVPFRELHDAPLGPPSSVVAERVARARARQWDRADGSDVAAPRNNSSLDPRHLTKWCRPSSAGRALLADASDRLLLSARGVHRVLKVARTIADLAGEPTITETHLAEAVQYRSA